MLSSGKIVPFEKENQQSIKPILANASIVYQVNANANRTTAVQGIPHTRVYLEPVAKSCFLFLRLQHLHVRQMQEQAKRNKRTIYIFSCV